MKRSEIQEGAEYVVLAPSQRDKVDGRYSPRVKRVRVLNVEPTYVERWTSFGDWDKLPKVQLDGFDDDGLVTDIKDKTRREEGEPYRQNEAKRVVRCLVAEPNYRYERRDENGRTHRYYTVQVIQTSMIAMTWAEYLERRAAADAREKRLEAADQEREKAAAIVRKDREKRAQDLNELLAGSNLVAKVVGNEVVITGAPADLLDAAHLVANA